jgi:predicted dehydrogenase
VSARPLRAAVIGVGHLGRIHAKIYHKNPGSELAFVCDIDERRARSVAVEFDSQALGGVTDLPDDIDVVSIVVPTTEHAAIAEPLLERGVACLVEKPMAVDLEEADRILAAAERGGAKLAVGHVERFQPGVRKVHELGMRPRFIECHRLAQFSFRSTDVSVVHDLMIHDLDLVLDLMGCDPVEVDAVGGKILTESEDIASVRLIFEDGGRANVSASRVSLKPMRRFRLFSNTGYVSLDFQENQGLLVQRGPGWEKFFETAQDRDPSEQASQASLLMAGVFQSLPLELGGEERPLQAELDSFLANVREDTTPEVTGRDGRRALELAERITEQIQRAGW